jgi:formylglycine-generating enzyme required for sulfatase activity
MTEGPSQSAANPRVFISYSRDDLEFADQLQVALKVAGFDATIDLESISAAEAWERRLSNLIRGADTIVFVLSPSSAISKVCSWEVEEATKFGKRIIPVCCRSLAGAAPPSTLAELNYIFFYHEVTSPGSGFGRGLMLLKEALSVDLDWLREHTRLLQRAIEWEAAGRSASRLLSGPDVTAAKAWAARRPEDAPELTALHFDFIRASEDGEISRLNAERQRLDQIAAAQAERERALEREKTALQQAQAALRRTQVAQAGIGVLLVCIIAGLVGWINQQVLKEQWNWYVIARPYQAKNIAPHVLTADAERALRPSQTFNECAKDCPDMVVMPAGQFLMGSADGKGSEDEVPVHSVSLEKPFAVAKYEVTVGEWNVCVSLGSCSSLPGSRTMDLHKPITTVTWVEAKQYVGWLSQMTGKSYRLLSEAEWEYSARAGTTATYSFGDDVSQICRFANIADMTLKRSVPPSWETADCSDGYAGLAPVGSFLPNAFGLHDMHGNVWEWVENCYGSYDEPVNATASPDDSCPRVLRGGAFDSLPDLVRSSNRNWGGPGTRLDSYGFRVARTLVQ